MSIYDPMLVHNESEHVAKGFVWSGKETVVSERFTTELSIGSAIEFEESLSSWKSSFPKAMHPTF